MLNLLKAAAYKYYGLLIVWKNGKAVFRKNINIDMKIAMTNEQFCLLENPECIKNTNLGYFF